MTGARRLYLVDLVRSYSFVAILMFHYYSAVYFVEWDDAVVHGYLFDLMTWWPRSASFSGFTILGLFCFLAGWRGTRLTWRPLAALFVVGSLLLLLTQGEEPFQELFWEWDIYHYLMAALASLLILQRWPRLIPAAAVAGFLLTWIPFWSLDAFTGFGEGLRHALVGVCDDEGRGGWALLPWIGLSWAAYGFGVWQRRSPVRDPREFGIWLVILAASLWWWGPYYTTPVGPDFACHVFRQPPLVFWAHLVWIVFFLRAATFEPLNRRLEKIAFIRGLADLRINRFFGRAYFIHLFFLALASLLAEELRASPIAYDLFWLGILPATEGLLRLFERIDARLSV